jgi:hypothetical protein
MIYVRYLLWPMQNEPVAFGALNLTTWKLTGRPFIISPPWHPGEDATFSENSPAYCGFIWIPLITLSSDIGFA